MIARGKLGEELPAFASTPFLCLIDDHLPVPDAALLSNELEKAFVHACVVGQLGGGTTRLGTDRRARHELAVVLGQHIDAGPVLAHTRRADERRAAARRRP